MALRSLALALVFVGSAAVSVGWAQPDDRYTLRGGQASTPAGVPVDVSFFLDSQTGTQGSPLAILGWSLGVCHDTAELNLLDVQLGATSMTINAGGVPSLSVVSVVDGGFIDGLVIDVFGLNQLLPGIGYEIYVATYEPLAPGGTVSELEFCETLSFPGNPQVEVTVVPASGTSTEPVQLPGEVVITGEFVRGDCNDDGATNVADAIFLSAYLFSTSGSTPSCVSSCDGNDDGSVNVADIVTILGALFGAPAVPLPAPTGICGTDPTTDMLGCVSFGSCP